MAGRFEFLPHIALDVADKDAAVDFYTSVFDMELESDSDSEARLRLGELRLYVAGSSAPSVPATPTTVWLAFAVDDFEEARESFLHHGCDVRDVGPPDAGMLVADPHGMCSFISRQARPE